MTEPSSLSAAKAHCVEKIWLTPEESEEATVEELPPANAAPQVMTEPSSLSAAKAVILEEMSTTPEESEEATADEFPPLVL